MTKDEIEALLFEEEGAELDFKRDQYPFDKANREDKSELLKDILAFANAFRRTDAYILIGVNDVKGGRSKVFGVASQLDDAKLQQFVNSKTQRPVTFSYRDAHHDGHPIGIIHIPLQQRPLYTKSDYGKVMKEVVYLRRGSSTDTATPDEIAQMGAQQIQAHGIEPSFELDIFDRETGETLGHEITIGSTVLHVPPKNEIPDYSEGHPMFSVTLHVNRDYYRELTRFMQIVSLASPVSFALRNASTVSAHDVRMIFEIEDPEDRYVFMEDREMPEPPKSRDPILFQRNYIPNVTGSDIDVTRTGNRWRIECRFGKIQPHDTARLSDDLYAGAYQGGTLTVDARIYADNISRPLPARFDLHFDVEQRTVSLEDIKRLEYERLIATPEGERLIAEAQDDQDS